jgi:ABC-type nitrate/sulfonate/bicarbonate transport system ATPase subunit
VTAYLLVDHVSKTFVRADGRGEGLCVFDNVTHEPFAQIDALTRSVIQDELVRMGSASRNTVFMVTHDVDEAILPSDRMAMPCASAVTICSAMASYRRSTAS